MSGPALIAVLTAALANPGAGEGAPLVGAPASSPAWRGSMAAPGGDLARAVVSDDASVAQDSGESVTPSGGDPPEIVGTPAQTPDAADPDGRPLQASPEVGDDAEADGVGDTADGTAAAEAPNDAGITDAADDSAAATDDVATADVARDAAADDATDDAAIAEAARAAAAADAARIDDLGTISGVAPGGYHGHGVILERPPPDGHRNVVLGSILFPLGLVATVTSGLGTWATVPQHCVRRLASIGVNVSGADRCQGVFAFNVVRTSYGALMLISGSVILALGLGQRAKYRAWRQDHGMRASLVPWRSGSARGVALGVHWRF
ncbi:MAG: hypothetical protein K0V04_03500 [Deltaproteobacteria bacterium]|nr:hypothetical protein [Deltaproteobacteria bacterium]